MFITKSFVFIHLHKSGGTFVNRFLQRFFPDGQRMNWHLPRAFLPRELRALPVLGVVRNPWDYYVSWFTFQSTMRPQQQNALYRVVSDDGKLAFSPTIANLVQLCEDRERLQAIRAQLPDTFVDHGINLTKRCIDPLLGSGRGFYSFLFHRMFAPSEGGDESAVTFARMESLRGDLLQFLGDVGVEVTTEMRDFLLRSQRVNVTEHAPFATYYDPALRDEVGARDRDVIERFGYTFKTDS